MVAELSYMNKDYVLYFRGQGVDYPNQNGSSSFFPSIYRERLTGDEIFYRFEILNQASKILVEKLSEKELSGNSISRKSKYIQWSILQHYGVCETPLLDFTHSIRVACTFARLKNDREWGYFYVFALPYLTNRISINSEHEIVNVRLLSISPPDARRPYYQEGYLVGTGDITTNYNRKGTLDFKRRLIAKFKIPTDDSFWEGLSSIPESLLYPENDKFRDICEDLKTIVKCNLLRSDIEEYFAQKTKLENSLTMKIKKLGSEYCQPK